MNSMSKRKPGGRPLNVATKRSRRGNRAGRISVSPVKNRASAGRTSRIKRPGWTISTLITRMDMVKILVICSWNRCPTSTVPSLAEKAVRSVLGGRMLLKVEVRLSMTACDLSSSRVEMVTSRMKKDRTRR